MTESKLNELILNIKPGTRAHLIGIGGVSMSPLAIVLKNAGVIVSGSDIRESETVISMREMGISIVIGHFAENVESVDYVIRTAAVHDDNPEIVAAHKRGIPVFERAEAWGLLMRDYKNALCISGTHGKTTTTSMSAHIMMSSQLDPTVMLGGVLPMFRSGYHIGKGDTIILESCEYCDSFLSFFPTVAVILNIEADHLDYFKTFDNVKKSFREFSALVPKDSGLVVANIDDATTMEVIKGIDGKVTTFGLSEGAYVTAKNIDTCSSSSDFDVYIDNSLFTHVHLNVPGRHNIINALAAIAGTVPLGATAEAVSEGLSQFVSADRRFQYKGEYNGAKVYDDYAHHPGEIKVLLDMVQNLGYERVIVAFQPHTYTRTKFLFDDFVAQLKRADIAVICEIYPAREENIYNISSADLTKLIPDSVYCETVADVEATLRSIAKKGDIVLTVGAGELNKVSSSIVK